jgi:hypothetical protein
LFLYVVHFLHFPLLRSRFSGSAQQTDQANVSGRQAQLETVEEKKRVRKKLLDCRNVNKLESRFRRGKPVPRPQSKQASTGIKTEIYSLYKMKIEKLIISKLILSHQETTNNHYVALCEEVRELMSF